MRHAVVTAVAGTALCAGTVSADFVIGNLDAPTAAGTAFGSSAFTVFKAAGFTMTAGSALDLVDVRLRIVDIEPGGATASVQIWSGASAPTALLSTMSGDALTTDGVYTFTPDSAVTLNPGETYWVYVDNSEPDGEFVWGGSADSPSGPLATNAGYIFNDGPSSFLNAYEVNAIPTPAGVALLGAFGLAAARRRR